jgi:hypothetical protein
MFDVKGSILFNVFSNNYNLLYICIENNTL